MGVYAAPTTGFSVTFLINPDLEQAEGERIAFTETVSAVQGNKIQISERIFYLESDLTFADRPAIRYMGMLKREVNRRGSQGWRRRDYAEAILDRIESLKAGESFTFEGKEQSSYDGKKATNRFEETIRFTGCDRLSIDGSDYDVNLYEHHHFVRDVFDGNPSALTEKKILYFFAPAIGWHIEYRDLIKGTVSRAISVEKPES